MTIENIKGQLDIYREGFMDGWNLAMKEAKEKAQNQYPPNKYPPVVPTQPWTSCSTCGKSGISHEVCYNPSCPSNVSVRGISGTYGGYNMSTGAIGAVGSISRNSYAPLGANGPADPAQSWEKR